MSQANVKVAQGVFDAWNAGDMDALRELYDPDVILRTVEDWPEPGPGDVTGERGDRADPVLRRSPAGREREKASKRWGCQPELAPERANELARVRGEAVEQFPQPGKHRS